MITILIPIATEFHVPLTAAVVGAISFCLALLAGPETKGTRFDPDLVAD